MRRQHTGRKRETLFGFSCRLGITFVSCMPIRISQRRIRCSLGRVVGSRGITARLALFCGVAVAFTLHSIPLCAFGINGRRWRTQSMPRKEEIPRLDVMVHKAALMDTFQCSQTGNTQPKSIVLLNSGKDRPRVGALPAGIFPLKLSPSSYRMDQNIILRVVWLIRLGNNYFRFSISSRR